ncbi:MAG: hypothetical protein A4E58_02105 [Syntrophorhabdus sp. PtaB.Bin006]|nr:MAG: hypothetical protein A4E58_02105 [Syntrophorhabdus sp. PtaB.Bin006]
MEKEKMDQLKEAEKIPYSETREFDVAEEACILRGKLYCLMDSIGTGNNCYCDGPYKEALYQMLDEATETLYKIEVIAKTGRVKENYYEDFKWVPMSAEESL